MEIIVRKPTNEEIVFMKTQPTWGCEPSTFDWHYDSQEEALIIKGDVTVRYDDKSVHIKEGDYVIFPKGLSCVWEVREEVLKHYIFK